MPVRSNRSKDSETSNHVTQKDVAKRAGVSPTIVSYIINQGPRSVSEETRLRVQQVIDELHYRPNVHAQQLISDERGKTSAENSIGVILGGSSGLLHRPYYGGILTGIYQEAKRQGKQIRFISFHQYLQDPIIFNNLVHPEEVSGIILMSGNLHLDLPEGRQLVERTLSRVRNVITVGRKPDGVSGVQFNLHEAARMAVTHLYDLAHRRIAYIGNPDRRYHGYLQALREHGLSDAPDYVFHPAGGVHSADVGFEGVRTLLKSKKRPTALFGGSDDIAMGAIEALFEMGLKVPEDVAVIGVNDMDWAAYTFPALTTIHLPREAMGSAAVSMLVDRARHLDEPPVLELLPTELVIRESCGYYLKHSLSASSLPDGSYDIRKNRG